MSLRGLGVSPVIKLFLTKRTVFVGPKTLLLALFGFPAQCPESAAIREGRRGADKWWQKVLNVFHYLRALPWWLVLSGSSRVHFLLFMVTKPWPGREHDRKRKSLNNMSSSPFLGAKFANGKHNSEFTIQTRGNEFAPISGTFFIAFWKCRPRDQHLPLIEDPHEIFNKNKSMRNFPSELGNQFLQNVWQLKILSKKIRGMLLIVLKDKVKSIERISTFLL